jgi:hypothetical protein
MIDQVEKISRMTEKEVWMFGEPGKEFKGYDEKDYSQKEKEELENMWEFDHHTMIAKGVMQGFTRGLYNDYDFAIDTQCLDKETSMQLYYIIKAYKDGDAQEIFESFMLMYVIFDTF